MSQYPVDQSVVTTEVEESSPIIDRGVLEALVAAFGSLFGVTLLALIVLVAIFVTHIVRTNRKRKDGHDKPLQG